MIYIDKLVVDSVKYYTGLDEKFQNKESGECLKEMG